MIDRNEIIRHADAEAISAPTVERDYVLTQVLASAADLDRDDQMVVKGGTAMRLCYFTGYRYSADLDFSLVDGMKIAEARQLVARALDACRTRFGFPVLELTADDPPRIQYAGPLGAKPRRIKLDLADDELVEDTTQRSILRRYSDQPPQVDVAVYVLEEMAAEKLRCIMQRLLCRDLFDLHDFFEVRRIDLHEAWPRFERKAHHRGLDPSEFRSKLDDRIPQYRQRWKSELENLVPGGPPDFRGVERGVRRNLRPFLSAEQAGTER